MGDYQRKVWATVDAELLAKIEAIRDAGENASGVRPSVGAVVLMLIRRGLEGCGVATLSRMAEVGAP